MIVYDQLLKISTTMLNMVSGLGEGILTVFTIKMAMKNQMLQGCCKCEVVNIVSRLIESKVFRKSMKVAIRNSCLEGFNDSP